MWTFTRTILPSFTFRKMKEKIRLWLDDVRDPVYFGRLGWVWVKTYQEAIDAFEKYDVIEASLDHDLTKEQTLGFGDSEKTGYDVVCWMEENHIFPVEGVTVHSANPSGAKRMVLGLVAICRRHDISETLVRRYVAPFVDVHGWFR